jgi:prepilin peptidase CpaA
MSSIGTYCTLGVLTIAAIDDVKSRKVHNVLLGILAAISVGIITWAYGTPGIQTGVLGFFAGFALYFPLAWMGVVGGGDLKLLAVAGLSAGAMQTLLIGLVALAWGTVLGIIQVALKGELKVLLKNIGGMVKLSPPEPAKLHKIPFAAALWLAGLTVWGITRTGGGLL